MHNKKIEDIYKELNSGKEGLTSKEALLRIKKYGLNTLPKKKSDSFIKIFFKGILDPIVLLLVVTIVFSLIVGEVFDAIAIGIIIIVDLFLGAFQEWKAEKNADSLSNIIKVNANVIRDGKEVIIDSHNLVVGDVIVLDSGDKISADARIIESHNLTVSESVLTGESINVIKCECNLEENVSLSGMKNMLFAGTTVTTGRAIAIVISTGINTEVGKIADKVANTKDEKSPLTIRMEKFSRQVSMLVIEIGIIISILLFSKGVSGKEIFLSVIALSVSAMPEGLPLALTMALTITSNKMMKKNCLVKKLNSVESLGSCTYIASDKTGTLTLNEQTAKKIVLPNNKIFDVTGIGYNFDGKIITNTKENESLVKEIAMLGYINNESGLEKHDDGYTYYGDMIDVAFKSLGKKANIDVSDIETIGMIPYESENKYSAVFYSINDEMYASVKGSLEVVLDFCKKVDKKEILKQNESLASEGYRVIALASGKLNNFKEKKDYDKNDIGLLDFKGLVAFIDPIRQDAKASIKECNKAGINVIMITGDHPLTAYSIGKDLGLCNFFDEVTTTTEVNEMLKKGKAEFDKFVKCKKIFSRVTPLDKLEIVESLKRSGEFVAVTGDGVNDAPALKAANIGVAMGSGTDIARETADMIIVDDNFKSIVSGIKEGRVAYANIRKIIYFLISCGLAEVVFFCLAIMMDLPIPLVAIQLLWLNVVTDGIHDFALSFVS